MKLKLLSFLPLLLFTLMITSCGTSKKLSYFNDIGKDTTAIMPKSVSDSTIKSSDILQITVTSFDEATTRIFLETSGLLNSSANSSSAGLLSGYLVDDSGIIKLPLLGSVKASGLTKTQLANYITEQLVTKKLAIDPVISIRVVNYRISILGEVAHPGIVNVPNERITLPEALAQAGDLTAYGRRDNLLLTRIVNNRRVSRRFSLNNSEMFDKDIYFLQNQDMIYVSPNSAKIALNDRSVQLLPIITSSVSLVIILFATFFKR